MAALQQIRRVLVIDDDQVSLSISSLLLEAEGFEVITVESGESACGVAIPKDWNPEFVLADLNMPGLRGAGLAAALQARWPHACLLAMSAARTSAIDGYHGFIEKPFPIDGLRGLLLSSAGFTGTLPPYGDGIPRAQSPESHPALDRRIFGKLARSMPPDRLQAFLEFVLQDTRLRITAISAAIEAGDLVAARREAHALSGSAGMTGATALRQLAKSIETGIDDLDDLRSTFPYLEKEYVRLSNMLASETL